MAALRYAHYLALLFCFLLSCTTRIEANSSPNVDTGVIVVKGKSNDDDAVIVGDDGGNVDETDAAIQSILSRLSSWMKEKRKGDNANRKRNPHDPEEDIIPPQLQLPQSHRMSHRTKEPPPLSRPFVTLAYAQTLDGMIAAKECTSANDEEEDGAVAAAASATTSSNLVLSGDESMVLTHRLRNMHDAILVGGKTFLSDRPRLSVRLPANSIPRHGVEHPMPVVLDTRLDNLQLLLFDKIVVASTEVQDSSSTSRRASKQSSTEDTSSLPDISVDNIRTTTEHPAVICCSSDAAMSFLDVLEEFQEQQYAKRKPKKSYKITVYKKIDDNNDHEEDIYLPIKITIRVIHHRKKQEEDVTQDLTLTLLPCPIHEGTKALDLKRVLHQLHDQFDIGSVMVEGGAGILSSFLNASLESDDAPLGDNDGDGGGTVERGGGSYCSGKVVDCICVTIAPRIMGGIWGLPTLGGLDVVRPRPLGGDVDAHDDVGTAPSVSSAKDIDGNDAGGVDGGGSGEMLRRLMRVKEGEFVPLGSDCTFLGRI
mmetsp:Transcript_24011/g.57969  ORF Transcript_24011/g.57969 Transcript_24011/m.57969 type:complete len:538 (+) Transcript_24011:152-1765(+)|eukprot:CAMPEP_0181091308 /NCGR_PEP_ID=MMETSP1071-20121207/8329_1 /TAXON_ID=35127 /ORGANISM="Thalassiosira sp., Strain NH16" /LENGTH=537 /DNA_ID=CAMNT_0023173439 /DNA_START=37 /DNA_END=1650 /DNA_ORIENTATION=+